MMGQADAVSPLERLSEPWADTTIRVVECADEHEPFEFIDSPAGRSTKVWVFSSRGPDADANIQREVMDRLKRDFTTCHS